MLDLQYHRVNTRGSGGQDPAYPGRPLSSWIHRDSESRRCRHGAVAVPRRLSVGRDGVQRVVADPVLHDLEVRQGGGTLEAGREVDRRADADMRCRDRAKRVGEHADAHHLGDAARPADIGLQHPQRTSAQVLQRPVPVGYGVQRERDVEQAGQPGVPLDLLGRDGHLEEADAELLQAAADADGLSQVILPGRVGEDGVEDLADGGDRGHVELRSQTDRHLDRGPPRVLQLTGTVPQRVKLLVTGRGGQPGRIDRDLGAVGAADRRFPLRRIFRTLILLPWAVPAVVCSFLFLWILNASYGVLNYLLLRAHLISHYIPWLASLRWSIVGVIIPTVWKSYPFFTLLILAALQVIPLELYEAAKVDGAGPWATFRRVTWPGIQNAAYLALVLQLLWTFREFEIIYPITAGGPDNTTQTLAIYLYNEVFQYFHTGYASALGVVTIAICVALVAAMFPLLRRTLWRS